MPSNEVPHVSLLDFQHSDKLVHFFLFFIQVLLTSKGLSTQSTVEIAKSYPAITSMVISICYGGIIELLQLTLLSSRNGDILDFYANSLGCIAGGLVLKNVYRFRH